jgi:hypothetical protein
MNASYMFVNPSMSTPRGIRVFRCISAEFLVSFLKNTHFPPTVLFVDIDSLTVKSRKPDSGVLLELICLSLQSQTKWFFCTGSLDPPWHDPGLAIDDELSLPVSRRSGCWAGIVATFMCLFRRFRPV